MTDFFAQLAARHTGSADALQPRVPFRFEPLVRPATAAAGAGPAGPAPGPGAREELLPGQPPHPRARRSTPGAARPARGSAAPGPLPGRTAEGPAAGARESILAGPPGKTPATEAPAAGARPGRAVARTRAGRSRDGAPGDPSGAAPRPEQAAGMRPRGGHAGDDAIPAAAPGVTGEPEAPSEPWAAVTPPAPGPPALALHSTQAAVAADQGQPASPAGASLAARDGTPASTHARPGQPTPVLLPVPPAAARPATPRRRGAGNRTQWLPGGGGPTLDGGEPITVQVTIGKVEVRAAAPVPPERSHRPALTGPALADYLRRRSRSAGGER